MKIPLPVLMILAALLVAGANNDGSLSQYVDEIVLNYDGGHLK